MDRKTGRLDWIFNRSVFPYTVLASSHDLVMAEGHRYTLVAQLGSCMIVCLGLSMCIVTR
ncbi:hypothetical protein Hanom_Chr14g01268491 [Helianthus anomalus]